MRRFWCWLLGHRPISEEHSFWRYQSLASRWLARHGQARPRSPEELAEWMDAVAKMPLHSLEYYYLVTCRRGCGLEVDLGEGEEIPAWLCDPMWDTPRGRLVFIPGTRNMVWRTWGRPERIARELRCTLMGHIGFWRRDIAARSWHHECRDCRTVFGQVLTDREIQHSFPALSSAQIHDRMNAGVPLA